MSGIGHSNLRVEFCVLLWQTHAQNIAEMTRRAAVAMWCGFPSALGADFGSFIALRHAAPPDKAPITWQTRPITSTQVGTRGLVWIHQMSEEDRSCMWKQQCADGFDFFFFLFLGCRSDLCRRMCSLALYGRINTDTVMG